MVIVELDGSQHAEPGKAVQDIAQSRVLESLGYQIYRVWNSDINTNIDGVLDGILNVATARLSPSSAPSGHLLPKGEGSDRTEQMDNKRP